MTTEILDRLRRVDTPTVWNALVGLRGRSIDGFTRGCPVVTHPAAAPMVGYALTARLVSDRPSQRAAAEQHALRCDYYRYLEAGPRPGIVVIQDTGATPGLGAFWGEVNVAIHLGFGISGVITDGAVRDLDALDPALPMLGGTVCLSNGFAHLDAIEVPVEVFGMTVNPGDLIHADRHGATAIPPEHLAALPDAIEKLQARERELIALIREPGFGAEAMIRAWERLM